MGISNKNRDSGLGVSPYLWTEALRACARPKMRNAKMEKRSTVVEALRWAAEYLSLHKVPDSYIDAQHLLAHVLVCERKTLFVNPERVLAAGEMERFQDFIQRRARREPVQYITGEVEFRGLLFRVNRDVLIPRPETELLVEEAINIVKGRYVTTLDLCTGSGCIAVSIAKELACSRVYAVDVSDKAIAIAKDNAKRHGISDRITFLTGDLFEPIKPLCLEGKIDLIISNPPYVSRREMEGLQPEIKEYEPLHALYGGEDGLDFYRRIIHEAPNYLSPSGILIMEIGYGQADSVKGLLENEGVFSQVEVKKDLAGIDRIIKASVRLCTR